ncbi:phosphoribosylformylglycinamidine cyclo-ligase [Aquifex aeolicus]|uniref:Phosphoribosylformylglycinamidine cyclo-ligase n=1 Tax=Aquifex aeolicus (strain VF5) TaxID=224324 RepID=O66968_AQUAE|nr:phosphoribosylformylglycinamidine cyclo-ligase [Aquifex aeolicus]AAC06918.1 phosphoribosylformylglycinamidine cyclo-ligase [Aquifex aeolicus VF5]
MVTYRSAGVDIDKANEFVKFIKEKVKKEFNLEEFGGFASGFPIKGYKKPILFSTTDGVGTKLKVAQAVGVHNTVGIDLVAMNVNDLITTGADPFIFLDYIATGKLDLEVMKQVMEGIIKGCREGEVILAGGETAEMPGFYPEGVYDLAGFCVGLCEEDEVITGKEIKPGDLLLGLPSSGFHSNGYSLIRKVLEMNNVSYEDYVEELGKKVWEVLLVPTRIYVKEIKKLKKNVKIKGIAHITGGGIPENLIRILPEGTKAVVYKKNIPQNPVFSWIQRLGNVEEREMFRTFNMGVGMIVILDKEEFDKARELIPESFYLGEILAGRKEVEIL